MSGLYEQIASEISAAVGTRFTVRRRNQLGGGCINRAFLLADYEQRYFVKLNRASLADMFAAESDSLRLLADTAAVRVPQPVCHGVSGDHCYLVLEYIEMGRASADSLRKLGEGVAVLHQTTVDRFGWHRDNTIGATPQINTQSSNWVNFWRRYRLGYQLKRAADNGLHAKVVTAGEKLASGIEGFFSGYEPAASLLHGDLWGGNFSTDEAGNPVVFDPATYYGDRETDVAMTELFGGFGHEFYYAYQDTYPLDTGYAVRKSLYNLYHVLNHFNLFGGGYGAQAQGLIHQLLSELG